MYRVLREAHDAVAGRPGGLVACLAILILILILILIRVRSSGCGSSWSGSSWSGS
jgi:hypothetical protein